MINIYYKNNKDGSLELVISNDDRDKAITFDSLKFSLSDKSNIDLSQFEKLHLKEKLITLDEIRNDEFDVFYLKMNDEIIFQISWTGGEAQQFFKYDKSMTAKISQLNKTVYEAAISRFLNADKYEDLLYPFWT